MGLKEKKITYTAISLAIMAALFAFSAQTAAESEKISGGVQSGIGLMLYGLMGEGELWLKISGALEFLIRKSAHIFIYFCLGISVSATLNSYGVKRRRFIFAALFCLLYAASDEFHQYFVEGRSAEVRDVMIDTAGSAAGAFLYRFFIDGKKRIKKAD